MQANPSSSKINHAAQASTFNEDVERTEWHDKTLWYIREKRDRVSVDIPEWETLRDLASNIKEHTLSRLDEYLVQFEQVARKNGVHVHWARDAKAHNEIVHRILDEHGARRVVKSKSMLTEECHLNPYLEAQGIEVVDTDLGERIVQLAGDTPSHIVLPAIHLKKEEVGEVFHRNIGTEAGSSDPNYLTEAARQHLRQRFLDADAAITGVNFAIAETGGIVICTNEGNADMGIHTQRLHIASMGLEKVIPLARHLGVFVRLLARSATGQHITTYTSHIHRPAEGHALHVILVDNGRTEQLGREHFRNSLKCIRCGACMNTCPIYRRSGGHSYGSTVPGPIGSILSPGYDLEKFSSLPFASTLCGSCSDVCPVKIDIHNQLYLWRQKVVQNGYVSAGKKRWMYAVGQVFGNPELFRVSGRLMRTALRRMPRWLTYLPFNVWGRSREVPKPPRQSFRDWYIKNKQSDE